MSGTYTRIILIQDMGCFINVELKNPPKRGTQYFGTNAIIRLWGENIVKGVKLLIQTFRRDGNVFKKTIK